MHSIANISPMVKDFLFDIFQEKLATMHEEEILQ